MEGRVQYYEQVWPRKALSSYLLNADVIFCQLILPRLSIKGQGRQGLNSSVKQTAHLSVTKDTQETASSSSDAFLQVIVTIYSKKRYKNMVTISTDFY